MPFQPEQSLLRVEVPALHTIDTNSVENLFGMWSLFSKTSHAMQDGKRLENLSWRLWNRETFCCEPKARARSSKSSSLSSTRRTLSRQSEDAVPPNVNVPELSSSPESAFSEDDDLDIARPELRRHESNESRTGGHAKHITPNDLEKIVIGIQETKPLEPIELPMPTSIPRAREHSSPSNTLSKLSLDSNASPCRASPGADSQLTASHATLLESSASTAATQNSHMSNASSQAAASDESSVTEVSTHSIIRGFIPGGAPSSYRSQTNLAAQPTPILKKSPQYQQVVGGARRKGATFTIGSSSGEEESSLESHMYKSSLSESLKRPTSIMEGKKQTSFKEEVAVGRAAEHSAVFESDDEDEEVSESAIEDEDDSSDWEDSDDQSGPSSVNERELFQRVDSRPNLTSRRSLLTTLMHEPDRAKALSNAASRSTPAIRRSRTSTPNGPSVATSPESGSQLQEHPRAKPILITASSSHPQQLALSPRTTRRNMLQTELTESLRKNLLWERQHRSTGNLAALKRRHTAYDMKVLRQHPEPGPLFSQHTGHKQFTNDYFHAGLGEYHAKGW